MRDLARRHSNWRATTDLNSFLEEMKIPGIAGLDTRRLTMHIRESVLCLQLWNITRG